MEDEPEVGAPTEQKPEKPVTPAAKKRVAARTRQQQHRARVADPERSSVGGRPAPERPAKGNPFGFDWHAKFGEPLGVAETRRQLLYALIAVARIMRSKADVKEDLAEELDAAADAYADVANHLFEPLRMLPRIVAPLVLIGALIAIGAAIVAETPWMRDLRERWGRRAPGDRPVSPPASQPAESGPWSPPVNPMEPADQDGDVVDLPPVPRVGRMRIR